MSMMWVGIGSTVLGAGASLYGANKQSKDNQAAQDQNARLQQEQNNNQWVSWLMSRGVQPTGPISAGTIPQAGQFKAVNTRLPLWATMTPKPAPQSTVGRGFRGLASPRT